MRWQVQEAKQKFSEVLRHATADGPQFVTRHGEEVAVVIDIREYRRLRGEETDFREFLLAEPGWDEDFAEELDEIVRTRDLPRDVNFGED
ncbi:type II toxin-antitoxin system Phd/YefM family antitoxin [Actinacidiphila oryziradicis]|uniref:Antitoxin n=1 Tax=Actinacidiphila oryziradicis TaxID=2571141 RepID=A0A4V5N2N0_9ACTN|nr:type II toxin-antitoxin system Phd/YefM family antitoxin [Actinacidiphila oryziradicis]TKA10559.1 type II toxin-antitoxin system Phd/YefM family antitoxin [Actinacidiphila oryziradicis]